MKVVHPEMLPACEDDRPTGALRRHGAAQIESEKTAWLTATGQDLLSLSFALRLTDAARPSPGAPSFEPVPGEAVPKTFEEA